MQGWMRKYRRIILVLVIVFVSIPFIIWVAPQSDMGAGGTADAQVIAMVGDTPVYDWQLVRALQAQAQQKAQELGQQEPLTFEQLETAGYTKEVLSDLFGVALLREQIENRDFEVNRDLLTEKLRQEPMFQDEEGKFNPEMFNHWVQESSNINWNDLYADLERQVAHEVFLQQLTAPAAHIPDEVIEREIDARHTKLTVRYGKIEAPIELTEEEVRAYYEENQENFRNPPKKTARFVQIPMQPEVPAIAEEIVTQARAGADFAALAEEHSFIQQEEDAAPEWTPQPLDTADPLTPLFELEPGAVTDPIPTVNGFRIYKVLDKRVNEETGATEIQYRDIYLRATLTEEQKQERQQMAEDLLAKAEEAGSLEEAAQAAGREVQETGVFTPQSLEVENLPAADVGVFTRSFQQAEETATPKLVTGTENLYVAVVSDEQQGDIPPLEEIELEVREALRQARKQELPYQERVEEYVAQIEEMNSFEEIEQQFPELNLQTFESKPIGFREFIFENNAFLQGQAIYNAIGDEEPGAFGGPVRGFDGSVYFVELLEKVPPTDVDPEQLARDEEMIREQMIAQAEQELIEDYVLYLNQQRLYSGEVEVDLNQEAYNQIVGVAPGETAEADAALTETPDALPPEGPAPVEAPAPAGEETAPAPAPEATTPAPPAE